MGSGVKITVFVLLLVWLERSSHAIRCVTRWKFGAWLCPRFLFTVVVFYKYSRDLLILCWSSTIQIRRQGGRFLVIYRRRTNKQTYFWSNNKWLVSSYFEVGVSKLKSSRIMCVIMSAFTSATVKKKKQAISTAGWVGRWCVLVFNLVLRTTTAQHEPRGGGGARTRRQVVVVQYSTTVRSRHQNLVVVAAAAAGTHHS